MVKYMIKKISKHKRKILKLFIVCFAIGFIIAIFFYNSLEKTEIKKLVNQIKINKVLFTPVNNTINHIKILAVILLLSYFYIGLPLFIGLIISESFKIFLRLIFLYKIYEFNGLIYGLLYTLINNGFYIFILIYMFKNIIKIFKIMYKNKIKKENMDYRLVYRILIKSIIYIIIIFISDLLLYLYGNKIIYIIKHICKINV